MTMVTSTTLSFDDELLESHFFLSSRTVGLDVSLPVARRPPPLRHPDLSCLSLALAFALQFLPLPLALVHLINVHMRFTAPQLPRLVLDACELSIVCSGPQQGLLERNSTFATTHTHTMIFENCKCNGSCMITYSIYCVSQKIQKPQTN